MVNAPYGEADRMNKVNEEMVNDPYGEADRMNKVNKEMVNEMMFNFTPPHVANGHCLESIKTIATHK